MFWIHAAVTSAIYGFWAVYEKCRHGISGRTGAIVPVCGLIFCLRLCLAFFIGDSGSLWEQLLADLAALLSCDLWESLLAGFSGRECAPVPSAAKTVYGWKDVLLIAGLCVFYGCAALWKLGSNQAPVTEYPLASGEALVLELGKELDGGTLNWFLKDFSQCSVTLEAGDSEKGPWRDGQEIALPRAFSWGSCSIDAAGRYVRITNSGRDMAIAELVLQDAEGGIVMPGNASSMKALFDETEVFPEIPDYQSGAYFDESYYVRTAWEFLNGQPAYEITHPPLGKVLIALGAACFGASPFGFRVVGALFGVLMLPFLYRFGREMTGSRFFGWFAAFLFAFDFMHFTQTRLATIDVFITFFTISMFYFMYRYGRMSFYDTPLKRTFLPLGACGISFGLGIACKWTGFYAGAGLAVLFFRVLYLRYREYVYASRRPGKSSGGIDHAYVTAHFKKYTVRTFFFCVVFFAAVPFLIYLLSYIPFSDGTDAGLIERMWRNQEYMLRYHTGLRDGHPYASVWYEWPLMIRPVFYYSRIIDDTMRQGISAFGNPLVWWAGIPAFLYMLYLGLGKRDKNAVFLCIAYLSCYLPWCLVRRTTFAYHYFPSVPFVVCMIMYSFAQRRTGTGSRMYTALAAGYAAAAFVLFLLFYPVISGQPVSGSYVSEFLRWMDTWVLVQ